MADDNKRKYSVNYDELFSGDDDFSAPVGIDLSNVNLSDFNLGDIASGFSGDISNLGITPDFLNQIATDSELFKAFQAAFPEDAALLKDLMGGDYGFAPVGADNPTGQELVGPNPADSGDTSVNDAETKKIGRQAGTDPEQDPSLKAKGVPVGDPNDPMGTKKLGIDTTKTDTTKTDTTKKTGLEALPDSVKYLAMLAAAKLAYDDAERARQEARGWSAPGGVAKQMVRGPSGGVSYRKVGKAAGGVASLAGGGIASLADGGIASLAGGGNILDEEIKTYITNVLGNKKSQQEQAAEINAAAQKYNIGRDRIAQATGYGSDAVKQFLGPNIIGQKTAAAPYQVYDKASDTYRYVDAAGYEKWLSGIPLTPPNPVPDAPVYNGSFVLRGAGSNAEGYPELDYVPSMPDNDWLHEVSDEERDDLEAIASMRIPPLASVVDLSNVKTPEQLIFLLQNLDPNLFNEMLSSYNTIVKETQPFGPGSYRSVSKEGIASDRDAYRRNVTDEAAWAIFNDPDKTKDFVEALQNPELFLTKNQGPAADVFREAFPRWLQILGTANLSTPNGLESDYAAGGMTTKQPFYLGGITDGMADEVPAHIDNKRPAALSDGEFVIPADVVSHLGNGNSNAGAKRLYEMMDNIREARTGNKNQGIQINPNKFMPR